MHEINGVALLHSADFVLEHSFPIGQLHFSNGHAPALQLICFDALAHGQNWVELVYFLDQVLAVDQHFVDLIMSLVLLYFVA